MTKILETLKQADAKSHQPGAAVGEPLPAPEESAALEEKGTEEMPFIEVGGKGRPLDGSPAVLASVTVSLLPAEAVPPKAPRLQSPPLPIPVFSEPAPLSVAFRPRSAPPAPRRPAPEVIAFHQPEHPVSAQYRALLGQLLADPGEESRVLLFTALAPGAGATTALLNLAVCACQGGTRRVVLLDANLARPALAARLGLASRPNVQEVLVGQVALEQALQTALPQLHVLAAAPPDVGVLPLLTPEAVRWIVRWLKERYDVVLVDGPVWEERPELAALASASDAVYLVLPEPHGYPVQVRAVAQAIARQGGRLGGFLHTQWEPHPARAA
jgi:Mrp family chromosome partitioning ATPase